MKEGPFQNRICRKERNKSSSGPKCGDGQRHELVRNRLLVFKRRGHEGIKNSIQTCGSQRDEMLKRIVLDDVERGRQLRIALAEKIDHALVALDHRMLSGLRIARDAKREIPRPSPTSRNSVPNERVCPPRATSGLSPRPASPVRLRSKGSPLPRAFPPGRLRQPPLLTANHELVVLWRAIRASRGMVAGTEPGILLPDLLNCNCQILDDR